MNLNRFFVMKTGRLIIINRLGFILVAITLFFTSCSNKLSEGMIIFTQVSKTEQGANLSMDSFFENKVESHILAIDANEPQKAPFELSTYFYSACSPEVSYNGRFMIFAAQKKQTGTWQIWEMNLGNLKVRQITSFAENCINPAYLPGDCFVFSRLSNTNSTVKAGYSLFTGNLDGTNIHQITFNPHTYSLTNVLQDGRVLTISQQIFPDAGERKLMVIRPDGTKQELFYQGINGSEILCRGKETVDGKIVFIESQNDSLESGDVISINYNRPQHSRIILSSGLKGSFRSVSPLQSGSLLVSYRPEGNNHYGLYNFSIENNSLSLIYEKNDMSVLEAVVIAQRKWPKKLPSEVNVEEKTGLLMCQDINFLGNESDVNGNDIFRAERIEVIGVDSTLGMVNVEEDGSFYLKVLADTPFRIKTIDKDGHVVKGPGSWIYLRPNERRGCIGCHEDRELVPGNRQPLSVLKDPINVPHQSKKMAKKQTGLE